MISDELNKKFYQKYGRNEQAATLFFAPGRVNLIGEHTDYNGGHVLPCALSYGTYLYARKLDKNVFRFASLNMEFEAEVPITTTLQKFGNEWINYPLGVVEQFNKKGVDVSGLELYYGGNIPNGAGLSSSASIELVTAVMLNDFFDAGFDMIELAKMSQKAENQFNGVNCGIMDQFAVGMGSTNKAIFLNCDTLDYELVPLVLNDYKIVIANTNKRRGLADSKYNERRSECEFAVAQISKAKPIKTLGELSVAEFESLKNNISDETVQRRARHAVSENERTKVAVVALKNSQLILFGLLMNASHESLKNDYEVTGIELDTLVDEAQKAEGVIGSRMTGAGFGGCTVSIVHKDSIDNFIEKVGTNYEKKVGLKADFYIADIGNGAGKCA